VISTTPLTITQLSSRRYFHIKGLGFLIIILISVFSIGIVNNSEQNTSNNIKPVLHKLGEGLSIATRLHFDPNMAMALAPIYNVPTQFFANEQTEILIKFDQELSPRDIKVLEEKGITFHHMEGQIVHIGTIYPVTMSWNLIYELVERQDIIKMEWGFKKYNPMLERSLREIEADKVQAGIDFDNPLSGKGISIGIVDTGIDWMHPAFWNPDPDYKYVIISNNDQFYADIDGNGQYSSVDKSIDINGPTGQVTGFFDIDRSKFNFGYDYILMGGPKLNPPKNKPSQGQPWDGSFWAIPQDENGNKELDVGEHVVGLFNCKIRAFLNDSVGDDGEVVKRQPDGWFYADPELFGDVVGHGTHVAAITAGGQLGYSKFTGIAPDASLIISTTTWFLSDMIREMNWAVLQGANIINLSLGSLFDGGLDGTSLFEQIIDQLFEQGIFAAIAAGNDNNNAMHVLGAISGGQTESYKFVTNNPTSSNLQWQFPDHQSGSYFVISAIWSGDQDLTFQVNTPSEQIVLGKYSKPETGLNKVTNAIWTAASNYGSIEKRMNHFYAPVTENVSLGTAETGSGFTVEVNNPSSDDVKVHIYLSGDHGHTGPLLAHWDKTEPALDYNYQVSTPATADKAIAVTSFVSTEWTDISTPNGYESNSVGEISGFASRGPRVDGVIKPNIAAPGELIFAAASHDAFYDFTFADLMGIWGTSQATPFISGSIALALEAVKSTAGANINPASLVEILYNQVDLQDIENPVPNSIWGAGKLNTYKFVLNITGSTPPPDLYVPGFGPIMALSALVIATILLERMKKKG